MLNNASRRYEQKSCNFNTKMAIRSNPEWHCLMSPEVLFMWKISHLYRKPHRVGTMSLYYQAGIDIQLCCFTTKQVQSYNLKHRKQVDVVVLVSTKCYVACFMYSQTCNHLLQHKYYTHVVNYTVHFIFMTYLQLRPLPFCVWVKIRVHQLCCSDFYQFQTSETPNFSLAYIPCTVTTLM